MGPPTPGHHLPTAAPGTWHRAGWNEEESNAYGMELLPAARAQRPFRKEACPGVIGCCPMPTHDVFSRHRTTSSPTRGPPRRAEGPAGSRTPPSAIWRRMREAQHAQRNGRLYAPALEAFVAGTLREVSRTNSTVLPRALRSVGPLPEEKSRRSSHIRISTGIADRLQSAASSVRGAGARRNFEPLPSSSCRHRNSPAHPRPAPPKPFTPLRWTAPHTTQLTQLQRALLCPTRFFSPAWRRKAATT